MPVSFQQQAGYEALQPEFVRAELANDDEVQFKKAGLEAAAALDAKAALDLEEAAEGGTTEAADDGGGFLSAHLAAPVTPAEPDLLAPVTPDDSLEEQEGQGRMAAEEEEGIASAEEAVRFAESLSDLYGTEAESDKVGTCSS